MKCSIDREQDSSNLTSSRLILTKVSRNDSGHYTCQATNKFGSDKMITNLLVQREFFYPIQYHSLKRQ